MTSYSQNQQDLIQYRLDKGKEAYQAAILLLSQQLYNASNSILYVSFFHHISAILAKEGHTPRKISEGVELFDIFLKNHDTDLNKKSYELLADISQQAIIAPFCEFTKEKTDENISIAESFFEQVQGMIQKRENLEVEIIQVFTQAFIYLKASKHTILHKTQQLRQSLDSEVLKSPKAKEDFTSFIDNPQNSRAAENITALLQNAFAFISQEVLDLLTDRTAEALDEISKLPVVPDKKVLDTIGKTVSTTATKSNNKNDNSPILQPWDFTKLSELALEHSMNIARHLNRPISLLHIVKKEKEVPDARKKMEGICNEIQSKSGLTIVPVVNVGTIFTSISEEADKLQAELVVMGTHGLKGIQKITGSWAMKVIADTKAPFLVVQEKPTDRAYNNIVIPISNVRDMKKVLNEVRFLNEHYAPTFHLVRLEKYQTEQVKKQSIQNFVFIKSFLKHNSIKYTDNEVKGTKNYQEAGLQIAEEVNAELIMILTIKDMNATDLLMGGDEQKVISNDNKIPVMCINPLHSKYTISTNLSGY